MAEVTMGTLYEMNQQLVRQLNPLPEEKLAKSLSSVGAWFSSNLKERYYMLLNKELSDQTVFHFNSENYTKAVQELREVLEERGKIMSIDYIHSEDAYEIWLKSDDDVRMYMLFGYSWGVIEI